MNFFLSRKKFCRKFSLFCGIFFSSGFGLKEKCFKSQQFFFNGKNWVNGMGTPTFNPVLIGFRSLRSLTVLYTVWSVISETSLCFWPDEPNVSISDSGPRSHSLVVRVVACEARGPGFDSISDQMVFSLLGYEGGRNKIDPDMINCMILCIHVENKKIILSHAI